MKAIIKVERGLASRWIDRIVNGELCRGQQLIPIVLIFINKGPQHLFNGLVGYLSLPICLRMVKAVESLSLLPTWVIRACQNLLVNWEPLSDIICSWIPCSFTTLSKYSLANCTASSLSPCLLTVATQWIILDNLSTKVTMALLPLGVGGSPTITSMLTVCQFLVGIGNG